MLKKVLLALLLVPFIRPVHAQTVTSYPVPFSGQYRGSSTYSFGDMVVDKKVAYFSIQNNNKGHTPDVNPKYWKLATLPLPIPPTPVPNPTPTGKPALIAHSGSVSGVTPASNTTGANFAVVCAPTGKTVSDSMHNAWQMLSSTSIGGYSASNTAMYVAYSLKTSSTHTFSSGDGTPLTAMAFSNIASGPDQVATMAGGGYPQVVGPITPTHPNELIVGCTNGNMNPTPIPSGQSNTLTVDAPYTVTDVEIPAAPGWPNGTMSVYAVQTTPSTTSIAFNLSQRNGQVSSMASFFSTSDPAPVAITEVDPLPETVVGASFTHQLAVQGGIQPYSCTLASGALPPGVALNGCTLNGPASSAALQSAFTVRAVDSKGVSATSNGLHLTAVNNPLTITTSSCPVATQLQPYKGCDITVTGGTGQYTCSADTSLQYNSVPEGMHFSGCTLSSTHVNGMGAYATNIIATDTGNGSTSKQITFSVNGDTSFGGLKLFPSDSIFHVDVATLPVDKSPAYATPWSGFQNIKLRAEFGNWPGTGGIPINTVPADQPMIPLKPTTFTVAEAGLTQVPFPCDASIEGTWNGATPLNYNGDNHIIVVQTGSSPALYEMYQGYPNFPDSTYGALGCSFFGSDPSYWGGAMKFDITSSTYGRANGQASSDAGGLPVAIGVLRYEEARDGTIDHPIRFTLQRTLNYHLWPATVQAGLGSGIFSNGNGGTGFDDPAGNGLLSQANPPTLCSKQTCVAGNQLNPMGSWWRLPIDTPEPTACSANPIMHHIFDALKHHGIILADNGLNGALVGTPDARWPDGPVIDNCLQAIPALGGFEMVNQQSVAASWPNTYQVKH